MTVPLVLGADTQPLRLGLALVTLTEPPEPVWADTFPVRPAGARHRVDTKMGGRVRQALIRADREAERHGGAVVRVGIERAPVSGPNSSPDTCWDAGGVFTLTVDRCGRVWAGTRLAFIELRPGQWKRHALGDGHGNDTKDQVAVWARRWAAAAGWDEIRMNGLRAHDSTDALGIAVGGVVEGGPA